jgi:hypothetical protein
MPDDLTRLRLEQASDFARAILDARADAALAAWTPLIVRAQREAAPLVRAVRVLATRSLALAAANGPGGSTENSNGHSNSRDAVAESAPLNAEPVARPRGPRIGRPFAELGPLRGVVAERVVLSTELDPFLALRALAAYSGLSVRTLRAHLGDPAHPLPCYRVGGKVLVRRSDYDAWALRHRRVGAEDVDRLVAEVLRELR